jgi:phosphonate C-P lyase system protein PhnH
MSGSLISARLNEHQSASVFRNMLTAMCRPGVPVPPTPSVLSLPADVPRVLLPALALADLDLKVYVAPWARVDDGPDSGQMLQMLTWATGATPCPDPGEADWVISPGQCPPDVIDSLRIGSAASPEKGAWLVLGCPGFLEGAEVRVSGPGTDGVESFRVPSLIADTLSLVSHRNLRPPAGVDTFLVAPDGSILAVPRTADVQILR